MPAHAGTLSLRLAARDNWDEVVAAVVRPIAGLLDAVEDASSWGRVGRRQVHPFEDPGVLLLDLRREGQGQSGGGGGGACAAAVSEAFHHLEDKIRLAGFLDANALGAMSPATQVVAFEASVPVPRPPWALPWVLKRDGTSGGTDVHFVTDPVVVDEWVESEQELAEGLPFQSERLYIPGWVLQQNIARPLLLQGRKFHLRAYALSIQRPTGQAQGGLGPPRVYLYDRYDVRLAGAPCSDDYSNHAAHVTNGNKDPAAVRLVVGAGGDAGGDAAEQLQGLVDVGVLSKLQAWLAALFAPELVVPPRPVRIRNDDSSSDGSDDDDDEEGRLSEELAAQAVERGRWSQFALLGADIMVDEDGRPWLLEFNHNPALPQLDLSTLADAGGGGGGGGSEVDVSVEVAAAPEPELEPEGRVGGAFAQHIATMIGAAIPMVVADKGSESREVVEAAVRASAHSDCPGRWHQVQGPPE